MLCLGLWGFCVGGRGVIKDLFGPTLRWLVCGIILGLGFNPICCGGVHGLTLIHLDGIDNRIQEPARHECPKPQHIHEVQRAICLNIRGLLLDLLHQSPPGLHLLPDHRCTRLIRRDLCPDLSCLLFHNGSCLRGHLGLRGGRHASLGVDEHVYLRRGVAPLLVHDPFHGIILGVLGLLGPPVAGLLVVLDLCHLCVVSLEPLPAAAITEMGDIVAPVAGRALVHHKRCQLVHGVRGIAAAHAPKIQDVRVANRPPDLLAFTLLYVVYKTHQFHHQH